MSAFRLAALAFVLLAGGAAAAAQPVAPTTFDREAGVRITHWPKVGATDVYLTVIVPPEFELIGPPRTQFKPSLEAGDELRLEAVDTGRHGTLVRLEAHFKTPVELPFYPVRFTVRVGYSAHVPAPIDVSYFLVLLADGNAVPARGELQWEVLIQSSPDGVFEPLD